MDREEDVRRAVEAADATGLVAGEELITRAETLLPIENLHAALPAGHQAHATIDKLHAELRASKPDPHAIRQHVGALRSLPELEATIATWWEDSRTQRIIADLSQIGL